MAQEPPGHSSIEMTLDIYSHVVAGLQEAAAKSFDEMLSKRAREEQAVANGWQKRVIVN